MFSKNSIKKKFDMINKVMFISNNDLKNLKKVQLNCNIIQLTYVLLKVGAYNLWPVGQQATIILV